MPEYRTIDWDWLERTLNAATDLVSHGEFDGSSQVKVSKEKLFKLRKLLGEVGR